MLYASKLKRCALDTLCIVQTDVFRVSFLCDCTSGLD